MSEKAVTMSQRLEDIRRLRERLASKGLSPEEALAERRALHNRILGVLIQDARQASGRSVADCASLLGIPEADYLAFEQGERAPTLPQLEVLAYFFNVPIQHFWQGETLSAERREDEIRRRVPELLMLRQRIIGVRLRQLRVQAGLSIQDVAEATGINAERIEAVENGEEAPPINELEALAFAVKANLDALMDGHGPVGRWLQAQEDFEAFAELPAEMRAFILKPINRSYLELAMRLSEMDVNRLRTIAESILDITL